MNASTAWARAAGITYRQLDYWARMGYLRPTGNGRGSGYWRKWPYEERRIAVVMARLVNAGVAVPVSASAAREAVDRAGGAGGAVVVFIARDVSVCVDVPVVDVEDVPSI